MSQGSSRCIRGQVMIFFYENGVMVPYNAKYLMEAKAEINQSNDKDKVQQV